jgi:hypothetical protein
MTNYLILIYGGEEYLAVMGYYDASFQTNRDNSKSQIGYVYMLNGRAISSRQYN